MPLDDQPARGVTLEASRISCPVGYCFQISKGIIGEYGATPVRIELGSQVTLRCVFVPPDRTPWSSTLAHTASVIVKLRRGTIRSRRFNPLIVSVVLVGGRAPIGEHELQ